MINIDLMEEALKLYEAVEQTGPGPGFGNHLFHMNSMVLALSNKSQDQSKTLGDLIKKVESCKKIYQRGNSQESFHKPKIQPYIINLLLADQELDNLLEILKNNEGSVDVSAIRSSVENITSISGTFKAQKQVYQSYLKKHAKP